MSSSSFKILQEKLSFEVDLEGNDLKGLAEITVKALESPLISIHLHARQLQICEVRVNDIPANFEHLYSRERMEELLEEKGYVAEESVKTYEELSTSKDLMIDIPRAVSDQLFVVTISFIVHLPSMVITLVRGRTQYLFTRTRPCLARYWFPCLDTHEDIYDFEVNLSVSKNILAISSGDLTERMFNEDGTRIIFFYSMPVPVPAYSIFLAVGSFSMLPDEKNAGITHFCTQDFELYLKNTTRFFAGTVKIIEEYLRMKLPFGSFKHIFLDGVLEPSNYASGCILPADGMHSSKQVENGIEQRILSAYVVIKQYFGVLVTIQEKWLEEGIAGYILGYFMKEVFGVDEFKYYLHSLTRESVRQGKYTEAPLLDKAGGERKRKMRLTPFSSFFARATTLLHHIEGRIGTKEMQQVLNYIVHSVRKPITTPIFADLVQRFSGISIKKEIESQWLKRTRYPMLTVTFQHNSSKNVVKCDLRNEGSFRGSIGIRITEIENVVSHNMDVERSAHQYQFLCRTKLKRIRRSKMEMMLDRKAAGILDNSSFTADSVGTGQGILKQSDTASLNDSGDIGGFEAEEGDISEEEIGEGEDSGGEQTMNSMDGVKMEQIGVSKPEGQQNVVISDVAQAEAASEDPTEKIGKPKKAGNKAIFTPRRVPKPKRVVVLHIQVDVDGDWPCCQFLPKQDDDWMERMFNSADVDVVQKLKAIDTLKKFGGSTKVASDLQSLLEDDKVFLRLRLECASAIAKLSHDEETGHVGQDKLISYFKKLFYEVSLGHIQPNAFEDIITFWMQKGLLAAIEGLNNHEEVAEFLLEVAQHHDNYICPFSDHLYRSSLFLHVALSNVIPREEIEKILNNSITRDRLMPSFQETVTVASLLGFAALSNRSPAVPKEFFVEFFSRESLYVQNAAIFCLLYLHSGEPEVMIDIILDRVERSASIPFVFSFWKSFLLIHGLMDYTESVFRTTPLFHFAALLPRLSDDTIKLRLEEFGTSKMEKLREALKRVLPFSYFQFNPIHYQLSELYKNIDPSHREMLQPAVVPSYNTAEAAEAKPKKRGRFIVDDESWSPTKRPTPDAFVSSMRHIGESFQERRDVILDSRLRVRKKKARAPPIRLAGFDNEWMPRKSKQAARKSRKRKPSTPRPTKKVPKIVIPKFPILLKLSLKPMQQDSSEAATDAEQSAQDVNIAKESGKPDQETVNNDVSPKTEESKIEEKVEEKAVDVPQGGETAKSDDIISEARKPVEEGKSEDVEKKFETEEKMDEKDKKSEEKEEVIPTKVTLTAVSEVDSEETRSIPKLRFVFGK